MPNAIIAAHAELTRINARIDFLERGTSLLGALREESDQVDLELATLRKRRIELANIAAGKHVTHDAR